MVAWSTPSLVQISFNSPKQESIPVRQVSHSPKLNCRILLK